jgi:hypothetical protein
MVISLIRNLVITQLGICTNRLKKLENNMFANQKNRVSANLLKPLSVAAPPAGLEPATL